jgi:hypothetical protein
LTEGYPATNPSLRLLEFDSQTYELLDAKTYTADLHAANRRGSVEPAAMEWKLEYSFKQQFNMSDMSVASFEALAARLDSSAGDAQWSKYRGQGNGCLYVGGYTSDGAQFSPADPIAPCDGTCRSNFVALLNGTNVV